VKNLATVAIIAASFGPAQVAAQDLSITITNLTHGMAFTPVLVAAHDASGNLFDVGAAASANLQAMAEGGALTGLQTDLASSSSQTRITVVSMLVNTNDAFAGLRSIDVSGLTSGESMTFSSNAYDAGTELNSESLGTMPGPADGGEGFNAARTDIINLVRSHGGVVTVDDGLSSSVLDQSHRFDNPGMIVTITRI
jgi:hypothetical protein